MQTGLIRKRASAEVIGRWRADATAILVETEDPDLRGVADQILKTPQAIPVHPPEHFEFAAPAQPVIESPSTIKYLALFALELEERGMNWSRTKSKQGRLGRLVDAEAEVASTPPGPPPLG